MQDIVTIFNRYEEEDGSVNYVKTELNGVYFQHLQGINADKDKDTCLLIIPYHINTGDKKFENEFEFTNQNSWTLRNDDFVALGRVKEAKTYRYDNVCMQNFCFKITGIKDFTRIGSDFIKHWEVYGH